MPDDVRSSQGSCFKGNASWVVTSLQPYIAVNMNPQPDAGRGHETTFAVVFTGGLCLYCCIENTASGSKYQMWLGPEDADMTVSPQELFWSVSGS